ncbi:L-xylulose reductase [Lamellibrachia satsuma]|nr:L-xylulose reductase [Lamellibrachia satsuma]
MDIRFNGQRALVTGAGKGIGNAIAKALAAGGAETIALSRTQGDLDKLKAENPKIRTLCVDLSDWAATRKAVEEIGPVDLLVNNAAVLMMTAFLEVEEAEIRKSFDVNVKAAVNVAQVVAKGMVNRGKGGAIVNISAILSHIAMPSLLSYCTSKAALDQVTRVMALELGPHQIRTNCVNPTIVMTAMGRRAVSDPAVRAAVIARTPQGKFAEVKDIVHAVMYLLSDKADMINGVTLDVDGAPSNATACVTSLKAHVLNVFPLLKAGPRAGKRCTPSSERLTSSPYKDLLRSKQIKLGEKSKSRAGWMSVKKSDRRELQKGKRATANGKARQPLADRLKERPGSGRTDSVYRCI